MAVNVFMCSNNFVRLRALGAHVDDVTTVNKSQRWVDNLFLILSWCCVVEPPDSPLHWPLTPRYIDILIALSDQCQDSGGNDAHPESLACRLHVQCHRDPACDWLLPALLLRQP